MSRPNFSMILPGTVLSGPPFGTKVQSNNSWVSSAENTLGVSRRKPVGWIPPTNYSYSYVQSRGAYGSHYYYPNLPVQNGPGSTYSGVVGPVSGVGRFNANDHFNLVATEATVRDLSNLAARALTNARSKMKSMSVDLGTAFGERNQTAHQLGSTCKRMAESVRQLRHGNVRGAMRTLGISAQHKQPRGSNWINHWLELQYGWKPLLSDIYGACDALSKRPKSDWRVTAKSKISESVPFRVQKGPGTSDGTVVFDACILTCQVTRGAFCRIDALPDNDLLMSLASLGVTNPLAVAWELVPYSFVVDWVFPIGNWLSSLDALLGYTNAYTSQSTFVRADWLDIGISNLKLSSNPNNKLVNEWTGSKKGVWVSRTGSAGVPIPPLPRLKDPRSLGHMANGLALLAQAFRR